MCHLEYFLASDWVEKIVGFETNFSCQAVGGDLKHNLAIKFLSQPQLCPGFQLIISCFSVLGKCWAAANQTLKITLNFISDQGYFIEENTNRREIWDFLNYSQFAARPALTLETSSLLLPPPPHTLGVRWVDRGGGRRLTLTLQTFDTTSSSLISQPDIIFTNIDIFTCLD